MKLHSLTDFAIPVPSTILDKQYMNLLYFSDSLKGQIIFHSHEFIEFIFITAGNIHISIEGNQFSLSEGCLIAVPGNTPHSTTVISEDGLYNRTILHIDPKHLRYLLQRSELSLDDFQFLNHPFVINQDAVTEWGFEALFKKIYFALNLEGSCQKALIDSLATEFLILIRHIATKQMAVMAPATNATVTRIIRYINDNFENPNLSIDDVAESVYTSRGHLSRIFKTFTGISVYTYIIRLRLEHARVRIFTGSSIMDACMKSGFSEYTSFLKSFKKTYGLTPKQFKAFAQSRNSDSLVSQFAQQTDS